MIAQGGNGKPATGSEPEMQEVTGTMWLVVAAVLGFMFVAGGAIGWLIGFTMGRVG